MAEQERRERELDRVAPPNTESASDADSGRATRSDDPAENQERALESGEENPV